MRINQLKSAGGGAALHVFVGFERSTEGDNQWSSENFLINTSSIAPIPNYRQAARLLLFTHTHSHQRFVKAQRRSLRPRYACVYYFYENECTLAAGPELYKYKSILVLIGAASSKNLRLAAIEFIRSLRKPSSASAAAVTRIFLALG